MKIEWLNDECTEAIVTRGWFRKRWAHVKRGNRLVSGDYSDTYRDCWVFAATGRYVGWRTDSALDGDIARRKAQRERDRIAGKEWVPVPALPAARLVERKP